MQTSFRTRVHSAFGQLPVLIHELMLEFAVKTCVQAKSFVIIMH